jgi:dTDP-glucose 4,6-dehydratase
LICSVLDTTVPPTAIGIQKYDELITYVADRAGHDVRYAVDASKILRELDWSPKENFESGVSKTVKWYVEHPDIFN